MNKIFFLFSLWITKLLSFMISVFHLGQASNFPGKIALFIKKDLIQDFKLNEKSKIILITGTNGKSTTTGILANILKASGKKVIYNKSGANLLSGIITALCSGSNIFGHLKYDYIILEVDEATLPLLTSQIKPDLIAVTNFFRDQLDRFGELDTTVNLIKKGISNNKNTTLVLNADDVRAAFIDSENKKIFYGFSTNAAKGAFNNESNGNNLWQENPEEITTCPKCGSSLIFSNKFLAHLGDYKCSGCGLKRPEVNFLVSLFKTDSLSTYFDITFDGHKNNFFISLIGVFNLYNALCAITIAKTVSNTTNVQVQKGLQSYSTIFGRGEKIDLKNRPAWIYLIKNPTGTTEVLKTLTQIPNARFLIAINDDFADGRDVSWLWDAQFDILSSHKKEIYISGKRALDMALRLKYADINSSQIKVNENITSTITNASKSISQDETLFILPTYTALLEMQRKGLCKSII
ncbi:MAG: DUF1727 domain-containing protein [Candidatus Melainabacteria bacterium]|nr:DUF1727 domain-containing protein [Candidatus Melainabacteria bacterium]